MLFGMDGFSQTLLTNHFTLYQGYVTNTNKLSDRSAGCCRRARRRPPVRRAKRRFGWE